MTLDNIPGIEGTGTEGDPFVLHNVDALYYVSEIAAIEKGLYFKLGSTMNCTSKPWRGIDLNEGSLDIGGCDILNPNIENGGYLFRNGRVFATKDKYDSDGNQVKTDPPTKDGKILDVRGSNISYVFDNVILEHTYISVNYNRSSGIPFNDFATEQCNLVIFNGSRSVSRVLFNGKVRTKDIGLWDDTNYIPAFVDTRFEINGYAPNESMFKYIVSTDDSVAIPIPILDHCIVTGLVDCSNIRYASSSSPIDLVYNTIKSVMFNLKTNTLQDEPGYRHYSGGAKSVNISTKSRSRDGNGVWVGDNAYIYETEEPNLFKPQVLFDAGFDIIVKNS